MSNSRYASFPVHYGWVIVFGGVLTLFACLGLARFAYGMILPSMGEALGLDYGQKGFISSSNFVGYLVSVALAPFVMRRYGGRKTIAGALLLLSASMALMGRCDSFAPLVILYFFTGMGSGLSNVPIMVLAAHWFSSKLRGRATGCMSIGTGAAIVFSGFLIPELNQSYGVDGWRTAWTVVAIIGFGAALVTWLVLRDSPENVGLRPAGAPPVVEGQGSGEGKPGGPEATAGPNWTVILHLGFIYLIFGTTYIIYATFIVSHMVDGLGITETSAGKFWAWVGFFSIFSGPLFGGLSDRIGRKGGFMAVLAVQTCAYGLVGGDFGTASLYLSVALFGIAAWSIPTVMGAAVADYLGPARAAMGFSIVTFFFAGGQTIGPAMAGEVADATGTFTYCFLGSAVLTTMGVGLAALLKRPKTVG